MTRYHAALEEAEVEEAVHGGSADDCDSEGRDYGELLAKEFRHGFQGERTEDVDDGNEDSVQHNGASYFGYLKICNDKNPSSAHTALRFCQRAD